MGLAPIALLAANAIVARNLCIADAPAARKTEAKQRAANGPPSKQRTRPRRTTNHPIAAAEARPRHAAGRAPPRRLGRGEGSPKTRSAAGPPARRDVRPKREYEARSNVKTSLSSGGPIQTH
jgi:hypothetical protein